MRPSNYQGPPCDCHECVAAGVSDKPIRRDPYSGKMLHGWPLARWWMARDKFVDAVKGIAKGRTGGGFEPLVSREPGEDDDRI